MFSSSPVYIRHVPGGTSSQTKKLQEVNISLRIMSSTKAIVFILLPLLMTFVVAGDADAPAPTAGGSLPFVVKTLKKSCFPLNSCIHQDCTPMCFQLGYNSLEAACEIDGKGRLVCCCG
jgi:hypothetical protein